MTSSQPHTLRFSVEQATPPEHRKVSIQVRSLDKSGKSHFLSTMPDPLIINFDPSTATVEAFGCQLIRLEGYEPAKAYEIYRKEVLPMVFNREFDCQSVCLDTETFRFRAMQEATPLTKSQRTNEYDTQTWYRELFKQGKQDWFKLTSINKPFGGDPKRRCYHIGIALHMKPEFKQLRGERVQVMDKYVPAVEGAIKYDMGSYTNCVFWPEQLTTTTNDRSMTKQTSWVMWTVSPDALRKGIVDTIGGHPPFNKLPDTIENTWPALTKAWGVSLDG